MDALKREYCKPANAGMASTDKEVAKAIEKALESLNAIQSGIVDPCQMADDVRDFKWKLIVALGDDGWRVRTPKNKYKLTPKPEGYKTERRIK